MASVAEIFVQYPFLAVKFILDLLDFCRIFRCSGFVTRGRLVEQQGNSIADQLLA